MTEINTTEDFLEHFGVKGMKWGQRKSATTSTPAKPSRADKRFARKSQSLGVTIKIHNKAAQQMNDVHIPRINSKPQYQNQDFTRDTPLRRKYYADYEKAFIDELENAAGSLGTNKSGTQKYGIIDKGDGSWDVILRDVKHADSAFAVKLQFDSKGYITGVVVVDPMTHGEEDLDDFLEHFGVKGMKWGVRRSGSDSGPVSSDAAKAATFKQVAKKSGTKALSNEELQALVTRMNLEKQFNQLKPATPSKKATKFVGDFLLSVGKQQAAKFANDQIGMMITRAIKKA